MDLEKEVRRLLLEARDCDLRAAACRVQVRRLLTRFSAEDVAPKHAYGFLARSLGEFPERDSGTTERTDSTLTVE
jgi:hypothetical protein